MAYSKEFLEKTIKVWRPYSKEPLTLEAARRIAENMVSLAKFLAGRQRVQESPVFPDS